MAGQARREHRGPGALVSRRLVLDAHRGGLRGRVWVGHRHHDSGRQPATSTELRTRTTYRSLLLQGLAPDEAANLTAYLAGIAVRDGHWTLRQINQLLFLREMNRAGHFGNGSKDRLH